MIESVATALLIHLGKTAIDRFWGAKRSGASAMIDQGGRLGFTGLDGGRTLVDPIRSYPAHRTSGVLFGDFYLSETLQASLMDDGVVLVLIIEENEQRTLLFDADLDGGYEVSLPQGLYSIFVFLVGTEASSLFENLLYAIGFPSAIDLSGFGRVDFEGGTDVWDVIDDSPVHIAPGTNSYLDFLVVETTEVLGYPASFYDILQGGDPRWAGSPADLVPCPRCDGDGYVSGADLRRIRAMGHYTGDWGPGPCRLCNGRGLVPAEILRYRDIGSTPRERSP